jgi:hypothetical protein
VDFRSAELLIYQTPFRFQNSIHPGKGGELEIFKKTKEQVIISDQWGREKIYTL